MTGPDQRATEAPGIEVKVDPRVELLSILFRVAGAREYRRGRVEGYTIEVDRHFDSYKEHEAVEMVRELRRRDGISHDAVVKLAVHLEYSGAFGEAVPLDKALGLGSRWRPDTAKVFVNRVGDFAKTSRFEEFYDRQRPLYEKTESRLLGQVEGADLAWLDSYFGESSGGLVVVAGMLTGRASYGATVSATGGKIRYAIVGVESVDSDGTPRFADTVIETIVHELCHSYIRPVLDAYSDDLEGAGQALYVLQQPTMEAQAYRTGYTVMNETLTRASTHRYLILKSTPEEVSRHVAYNRSRGFLWLEDVARELEVYESSRQRYPTLSDFAPELVRFFSSYTEDLPTSTVELDRLRPQVVSMVPANGSINVDPQLEVIEITFDRPMRRDSWSVVGGGERYPDTDTPSFDGSGRVFRLPVRLEPDHDYEFWLNRGRFAAFVSREGIPLAPFHVELRTGPG